MSNQHNVYTFNSNNGLMVNGLPYGSSGFVSNYPITYHNPCTGRTETGYGFAEARSFNGRTIKVTPSAPYGQGVALYGPSGVYFVSNNERPWM